MIEINDKLDEKLRQQMDGRLEEDEELQLRFVAKAYAICENSIAVLSNLRTNKSHIYYGKTSDLLGFEPVGSYEKIESIWEEKILSRIHPDDQRRRQLQELAFCQFVCSLHSEKAFDWHNDEARPKPRVSYHGSGLKVFQYGSTSGSASYALTTSSGRYSLRTATS